MEETERHETNGWDGVGELGLVVANLHLPSKAVVNGGDGHGGEPEDLGFESQIWIFFLTILKAILKDYEQKEEQG